MAIEDAEFTSDKAIEFIEAQKLDVTYNTFSGRWHCRLKESRTTMGAIEKAYKEWRKES